MYKAKYRKMHGGNTMKPWTVDDLWTVFGESQKNDIGWKDTVALQLQRSPMAIGNVASAIKCALERATIDDARNYLTRGSGWSSKSAEALLEVWRRVKLQNHLPTTLNQVGIQPDTRLERELKVLDTILEDLHRQITTVILVGVETKTAEFRLEKDKEIASLRTVVEAAKQNNMADMLKNALRG